MPFLRVYLCANVGPQALPATTLCCLLAAAWPAPSHNPPPCWVRQPQPWHVSSLLRLPVSTPPTSLDECFFFISLVVGLPYSSIFCQFWLFFVFKWFLSFFWLCEEAHCVYLRTPPSWLEALCLFFNRGGGREKEKKKNINMWLPLVRPPTGNLACNRNWESNQ